MAPKVLREEIVENRDALYLEVETRGELKYMPQGINEVLAIFGAFERTGHGTLLYTFYLGSEPRDWNEYRNNYDRMLGIADSHYLDDLRELKRGNITEIT